MEVVGWQTGLVERRECFRSEVSWGPPISPFLPSAPNSPLPSYPLPHKNNPESDCLKKYFKK